MMRWVVAACVSISLLALLAWQHQRTRKVAACVAEGGVWNGAKSVCLAPPGRPILQRDLHRS